jgi:hypothetical protein
VERGATFSVVLRVLAEPAAAGRMVGEAEVVATGEVVALRAVDDLEALCRRLALSAFAVEGRGR